MNSQFTVTPGEHSSKYILDQMNSALFLESKKRSNYFRFYMGPKHNFRDKFALYGTLKPASDFTL
jgi:hypothetical protein